ncbi:hypothetical protein LPJGGPFB_06425 [Ensifer adhaerens]|uniref:hypothetical protein n=1 Tax=Ensifer adhaerens TaxID=106592 RepID=UPI001567EF70|nr:hypothetical protein [Ensifer adhaerens]NRP23156.1 hypothetical protein [Ensifer adhaerens]
MGPLGAALSALLAADIGASASRFKRNAALCAVVAVLLVTAYVFALIAVALYLSATYSPVIAAASIAAALILTALIVIIVMIALEGRDRRLAEERRRRSMVKTNLTILAATSILRKNPLVAVGTALAIGALLGTGKKRRDS